MDDDRSAAHVPPAVIQAGGVFLPAHVAYPLWLVLRRELDRHRTSGGLVRPEVAAAVETLRAAALAHVSANGPTARTFADLPAPSDRELIRTEQLAGRLGVTARHARRFAARHSVTPAARNAWHPDDVAHLEQLRRNPAR